MSSAVDSFSNNTGFVWYFASTLPPLVVSATNSGVVPDTAISPTENRYEFKEHKFSASGLTTFTAFQLKITMTGTSSCYPPRVKDLRGIALAV